MILFPIAPLTALGGGYDGNVIVWRKFTDGPVGFWYHALIDGDSNAFAGAFVAFRYELGYGISSVDLCRLTV